MAIEGKYRINAPRIQVWKALNDTEVLKASILGCEHLEHVSDTEIEARIRAALGPVRAVFSTRIALSDVNPPESYTLTGESKAAAGFAKGVACVSDQFFERFTQHLDAGAVRLDTPTEGVPAESPGAGGGRRLWWVIAALAVAGAVVYWLAF